MGISVRRLCVSETHIKAGGGCMCGILNGRKSSRGVSRVERVLGLVWTSGRSTMSKPDFSGTYHLVQEINMDDYLELLDRDIDFCMKLGCLRKPTKEIVHDTATGAMRISTITTFRTLKTEFIIGEEFIEDLRPAEARSCQTTVSWDGDMLECIQRGEKEGRGWSLWLEGEMLHLLLRVQDVVAKQVFKKAH